MDVSHLGIDGLHPLMREDVVDGPQSEDDEGEGEGDGAVSVANRTLIAFAPYHVRHLSCRLTMPAQQGLRGDRGGSPTGSRERSTECREDHSVCWPMAALGREADVREFAPGAGAP